MNKAQLGRPTRYTARDIKALMFGNSDASVTVTRQARRIHPDDSDELIVACRGRDYWVAQRLSDKITIWACGDEVDAEEQFERLADAGQGWVEARPGPLAG